MLNYSGNCKKLRVAIISEEIKYLIDNLFDKITLDLFLWFYIYSKRSLAPYFFVIKELLLHKFPFIISGIIFSVYYNHIGISRNTFSVINYFKDNFSLNKLIDYIWAIKLEKLKILVTIILMLFCILYIIVNILNKGYLVYAEFVIAIKALEKQKIEKVVLYQEEILEILENLYHQIDNNLLYINDIYDQLEFVRTIYEDITKEEEHRSYSISELMPFEYEINRLQNYSSNFTRIDEIIEKIRSEKLIKAYENYNKEFRKECFELGLLCKEYKYYDKKRIETDKINNSIKLYFDNVNSSERAKYESLQWNIRNYRNSSIKYYINIKHYLNKFEKRRNKIMEYSEFNSKLRGVEEKFKTFK